MKKIYLLIFSLALMSLLSVSVYAAPNAGKGVQSNSQTSASSEDTSPLSGVRSSVAQQVQKILSEEPASGGIGEQVREVARAQGVSQENIEKHLSKVEERSEILKSIFGSNSKSLNALKKEMEQNRVRVQQLEQLKLKLTNQGEITNVQEMITLMQEEQVALQDKVTLEESNVGFFGRLVSFFAK